MKAIITLDEFSPAKVEIEKEGANRTVYLGLQELANFIVSSVKEDEIEELEKPKPITVSPSLPLNTVKYSKMSDNMEIIFLSYIETKADITYHKTAFEDVPFPNLVFCFGVRNNRLIKRHVLCYKDSFLRDNTELYQFPYSNVFIGGNMCYHDNEYVEDLVQLQTLPYRWMHEPFNDHLYNQGRTNKLDKSLREIFESTQGQSFNYDMLIPMNITFDKWAESQIR